MLDRLLEFGALCRQNGLRLSTAEMLDAVAAAELVGVGDAEVLRGALEATLVKRRADADIFDELFTLYFHRRADRDGGAAPLVAALEKEGLSPEEIEHLLALIADEAARLSPVARGALGIGRPEIEALLRLAGVRLGAPTGGTRDAARRPAEDGRVIDWSRLLSPMQIGFFTQKLYEALDLDGARGALDGLFAKLEKKIGAEKSALMAQVAKEELQRMRASLRRYVADEFERRNVEHLADARQELLMHKPFGALSADELASLQKEVRRLCQKLKELVSLRPRHARRGRLDARRTLRRALASGGVPFRLVHKRRRIDKPRLVVLCDISDSVRHVSRFMLQFAYTLQELFGKVRSFVFVSELGECTDLFKDNEIGRAVNLAYAGGVVNVYANSNFGRAFSIFAARYLEAVTPKTTVLVIGDARNNYNPPEAWALAAIRERARRLLWLNPEPPASWAFGDSAMRDYEPYTDSTKTVGNLAQLARVVDALIL